MFTGDLTHTTDDRAERRKRMTRVQGDRLGPEDEDAALHARRARRREGRGRRVPASTSATTHYTFDHKGVHFVALDNVSDPEGAVGDAQLDWLAADLKKVGPRRRIVVFTHRPLFDLYPQWDWSTKDGAKVIDVLMPHKNVTVFYGHIHQEHHHMTGHIAHHAATLAGLPAARRRARSPKKVPLAWDPARAVQGARLPPGRPRHVSRRRAAAERATGREADDLTTACSRQRQKRASAKPAATDAPLAASETSAARRTLSEGQTSR